MSAGASTFHVRAWLAAVLGCGPDELVLASPRPQVGDIAYYQHGERRIGVFRGQIPMDGAADHRSAFLLADGHAGGLFRVDVDHGIDFVW